MKLIFERSKEGRKLSILPSCDVPVYTPEMPLREKKLHLPQMSENELSRHYTDCLLYTSNPPYHGCSFIWTSRKFFPDL